MNLTDAKQITGFHIEHVPEEAHHLGHFIVVDREGLQAYPKPGQAQTLGACQRFILWHAEG